MRRVKFAQYERVTADDLEAISTEIHKDFQEGFIGALGEGQATFIKDGFKPARVNATTVSIAAGRGYATLTVDDAEEPSYCSLTRAASGNVVISAAHATLNRIDIVVAARLVDTVNEMRDLRSAPGQSIVPTSVVKYRRESSAVSVILGVASGSPVAPSYDPLTQVLICEVLVTAATGVGVNGVTDKRRVAYLPHAAFGLIPLGGVIPTFPGLTGAYACTATTVADGNGFVVCAGQTIADVTSPMNGQTIPNINNDMFIRGNNTSGSNGGANAVTLTANELPVHTHTLTNATVPTSTHTHVIDHIHQTIYHTGNSGIAMFSASQAALVRSWGASDTGTAYAYQTFASYAAGATTAVQSSGTGANPTYTGLSRDAAGNAAISAVPSATQNVSANNTGSGNSFAIVPSYISSRYLMRIK